MVLKQQSSILPCVQPPRMVGWQDYEGPMDKVVGAMERKLERKSVPSPHLYKPGTMLCSLTAKGKFLLFLQDAFDPVTLVNVGFNAGIAHAQNSDSAFRQGADGYGKRFGSGIVKKWGGAKTRTPPIIPRWCRTNR